MKAIPVNPFEGERPGFNHDAARSVYSQLMKMDAPSALVCGRMIVGAAVQHDLFAHADEIAETVSKALAGRAEALRGQLARTSIAKARAGEDNTEELTALVELSKAGFFAPLFDFAHRSLRTRDQDRDPVSGQFEVMHERVSPNPNAQVIPGRYIGRLAIPDAEAHGLTGSQLAQFQDGYLQVARMLRNYTDMPDKTAIATFHYEHGAPTWTYIPKGASSENSGMPKVLPLALPEKIVEREIENDDGTKSVERTVTPGTKQGIDPHRRLASVTVDITPRNTAAGGLFASFNALGLPGLGALASRATENGGALNQHGLDTLNRKWNERQTNDQFMGSQRVFRRLSAGGELIDNSLGTIAPPQVKMALKVAQHVGDIGPSAHQIVAPTLDRAAYRYRGTERTPSKQLVTALDQTDDLVANDAGREGRMRDYLRQVNLQAKAGMERAQREHDRVVKETKSSWDSTARQLDSGAINSKQYKKRAKIHRDVMERAAGDLAAARDHYASEVDKFRERELRSKDAQKAVVLDVARKGSVKDGIWRAGPVLDYWGRRVPSPELNELQIKSGVVPPSEGVIIGPDNQIKAQTVGYGDDHYLPFTLRNLAGLRGGYYIRTRTFGGPTTEDIYTGLVSGAKGLTVVSNTGVYTLDFKHDLKGGRRFNDKAARMVARYGKLLDAVKAQQVSGAEIPPDRMREIYRDAAKAEPANFGARKKLIDEMLDNERTDPRLSQRAREAVIAELLAPTFDGQGVTRSPNRPGLVTGDKLGRNGLSLDDMAAFLSNRQTASAVAGTSADTAEGRQWTFNQRMQAYHQGDLGMNLARELGQGPAVDAALEEAQTELRRKMQPLRLDGHGYDQALKALREQFPYYIHAVGFHAKEDGTDMVDTGYVKPKHNRPEGALAGYFDPTIGGTPKVSADQIRYQNAAIRQGQWTPQPTGRAQERVDQVQGSSTADAPASPATARGAIDKAMLEHLLSLKTKPYRDDFTYRTPAHPASYGVKDLLPTERDRVPAGVAAIFMDPEETVRRRAGADPALYKKHMDEAVKWIEGYKAYTLDPDVLDAFEGDGSALPMQRIGTENLGVALEHSGREWDFGPTASPYLRKSAQGSKSDVEAAYLTTPGIKEMVEVGELPPSPGVTDFNAIVSALITQTRDERDAIEAWEARHRTGAYPPRDSREVKDRALAFLMAKQYGRRYQDAVNRDTELVAERERQTESQRPIVFRQETKEVHLIDPDGQTRVIDQDEMNALDAATQQHGDSSVDDIMRRAGVRPGVA